MVDPPTAAAAGAPGPDVGPDENRFPARDREEIEADPTGRLGAYLARTQTPLDLLALLTLWIVVVPVADFGNVHGLRGFGLWFRLVLSATYAVDMTIRVTLAPRHGHYLRTHPLGILAVVFPPVRVMFSLRLIRVLFQRGNLDRFLLAALLLMLNGALIVWLFEREADGSNIHTLGESIWWSIVTVTTVGYGDYYPVTAAGQVVAALIMFIGIVTVAVVTAQVASSFVEQSARHHAAGAPVATTGAHPKVETEVLDDTGSARPAGAVPTTSMSTAATETATETATPPVTLQELDARLSRIEQLLVALQPDAGGSHSSR